jgi:hypothetical protein
MENDAMDEVGKKLFVLQNYDAVFKRSNARQMLPTCCGQEFDIDVFLRTGVRPMEVEVDGERVMMFEVTCPKCGRDIPPEWLTKSGRGTYVPPEGNDESGT